VSDDNERGTLADYLITFAPWIGYIALTEFAGSWRLGFIVGLAISAGTLVWRVLHGDSRFMEVGTLAYCAAMTAVSQIFPDSPLRPYNVPLSLVVVGLLSLVSLAMRSPFTYRIARDKVPGWILKDASHHARLFHAHVVATSSWAAAQTAAGALGALLIGVRLVPIAISAQVIGTLVPVGVTRYQHERFMHSAVATQDAASPAQEDADDEHAAAEPGDGELDEQPDSAPPPPPTQPDSDAA
jgi:hypothetical protein